MIRHASRVLVFVLAACVFSVQAQTAFRDESAADARVIENLKTAGSDLSKPHPTRYYFYFPWEQSARTAAAELQQAGYTIDKIGAGLKKDDWLVLASKRVLPTLPVVAATSRDLNVLARKHSGVYDGWEAAVTK
jgi:hypothetical protein